MTRPTGSKEPAGCLDERPGSGSSMTISGGGSLCLFPLSGAIRKTDFSRAAFLIRSQGRSRGDLDSDSVAFGSGRKELFGTG